MFDSVKYEAVARKIEALAGAASDGEKLPSIRKLMKDFQASQATIEKSLAILCRKKVIRNIEGRGFFVSGPESKAPESLRIDACFFIKGEISGNVLYKDIAEAMLGEGIKRNISMYIAGKDCKCDTESFRRYVEANKPDAYILLGCTRVSQLHVLEEAGIPYVQLYSHSFEGNSPSFMIDNNQVIRLAVEHLISSGRKRIALAHGQREDNCYSLGQEERIDAFYEIMDEYGLPTVGNSVIYGGFSLESGYAAAKELLASRNPPDAIIGNDYNVPGIYKALFERNLRIPEDISVMGIDDIPLAQMLNPALTTIDINWKDAVSAAVEKAVAAACGNASGHEIVRIPVKLIKRESA